MAGSRSLEKPAPATDIGRREKTPKEQLLSTWGVGRGGPPHGVRRQAAKREPGPRAHPAAPHRGNRGAAGEPAAAHAHRRGRLAALGLTAGRAARGAHEERQHPRRTAQGARAGGVVGTPRGCAACGPPRARRGRGPRPDGDGGAPGRIDHPGTGSPAEPVAHPRGGGRLRRPVRGGAGGADLPAPGGTTRGSHDLCDARCGRQRGALDRARGRAHRPGRLAHGRPRRGRRPLDGVGACGEEPDAGIAVTREATLIPGDGIGPEITEATLQVLGAMGAAFDWDEQFGGMSAVEKAGTPLPNATLDSIRRTGLALKGPLTTPVGGGYRSITVALRQEFDLYANVRPVKTIVPGGRYEGIDLVIIRENTEGLYIGMDHTFKVGNDPKAVAQAMSVMTREGCLRVCRYAFEYAKTHGRKKVTIVHKANILKATSGLFLESGRDVAKDYEGQVAADDKIVDNCAMQLVLKPEQFDVIVTTNLFGDILSDLAAGLVGGLGLAPGANIGVHAAIFEAVHGSAPDIAGQGVANPTALMFAAAMMLDHVGERDAAERMRRAIETTIVTDKLRTRDLGGNASTAEFARAVARRA